MLSKRTTNVINIVLDFKIEKHRDVNIQIIHVPEDRMTGCLITINRDFDNQCYGGIAYRNPADADNPETGIRLALRRCLRTAWNLRPRERREISRLIRTALRQYKIAPTGI